MKRGRHSLHGKMLGKWLLIPLKSHANYDFLTTSGFIYLPINYRNFAHIVPLTTEFWWLKDWLVITKILIVWGHFICTNKWTKENQTPSKIVKCYCHEAVHTELSDKTKQNPELSTCLAWLEYTYIYYLILPVSYMEFIVNRAEKETEKVKYLLTRILKELFPWYFRYIWFGLTS